MAVLGMIVSACTPGAARPDGTARPGACASSQWEFARIAPVGDGPNVYLPVQVVYTSGPRCTLDIPLRATLTGGAGVAIRGGTGAGVLRGVIGPAAGQRRTSLSSVPASSFVWANWCAGPGGTVLARVDGPGHAATVLIGQRPECLDQSDPMDFTFGVKPG